MLQYLLNATAIWLLSLVVFDTFLRRETIHGYNRMYLLGTFILGLLLPLYSWQVDSIIYSTGISRPVIAQTTLVKQSIVESGSTALVLSKEVLLWGLYLTGACVSLVLLLKEIFVLISMYRKGDKSKDGVWTVVETGKEHTPFSAFRLVFISSKKNYDAEQLQIILAHEEQHGHLLHFIDLMFIQLAKIVFWFHPLAYIYHNRLMTVHEYQADAAVDKAPAAYGHFLIEQSILGPAPAMSHTFNRSPIKKRILMLTRKSSALSKSKTLIAIPLVLVCVLCFTKNAFSDDKKVKNGNKITYRGNTFEMKIWPNDTVMVQDPVTGQEFIKIASREPSPMKMNNKVIYSDYKTEDDKLTTTDNINTIGVLNTNSLKRYLINNLKEEFKMLPDGEYEISMDNIVLGENGKVVYYDYGGVSPMMRTNTAKNIYIPDNVLKAFDIKIAQLMDNIPSHTPADINGKAVPYLIQGRDFYNSITLKNGNVINF